MKNGHNIFRVLLLGVLLLVPAVVQAQFTFTTNNGAITITGYTGSGGAVVIPNTTNGYPVVNIGTNAFQFRTTITSILIGTNVTSIGSYAFANCNRLNAVCFSGNPPSGDSTIFFFANPIVYYLLGATGWGSTYCNSSTLMWSPPAPYGFTTNNGTVTIMSYFGSGGALIIPGTVDGMPVSNIATNLFKGNPALTSVIFTDGITAIPANAFYDCTNLTNVVIPESVTNIGGWAFGRTQISSFVIPNGVTSIGAGAFDLTPLGSITIPGSYQPVQKVVWMIEQECEWRV